jgi:hypothetical protein
LAVATNLYKTHPEQSKYARKAGEPHKIFLHAEIHGLIHAGPGARKIYVARLGAKGETRRAYPCPICRLGLEAASVKEIYYT